MGYRNTAACVRDLEQHGHLVRVDAEVDPFLEVAEIQRRVYEAQGPALLFTRPKGCRFPLVSNLFGTLERAEFIFRDTLERVRRLVELKVDPTNFGRRPWRYLGLPLTGWNTLPKRMSKGPVLANKIHLSDLPAITSWPRDGGPFVTLPQVYTEDPRRPGTGKSNLGMYRVQISGSDYAPDKQIGLHYQIHRGIGVHHAAAIKKGQPLRVNIFVGGPPAMSVAAVMPLPEGLPELSFAGALGGRRLRIVRRSAEPAIAADADFCITGWIDPDKLLPEGPFGDHLGYYSLAHDFPVLNVDGVYHRDDAIWPFTVVGRPPQEDTTFGKFIHELTGPVIPTVVHGVHAVHAVDEAGVHPLLLAIGSERYVPYAERKRPQELLTCANAILGQGQLSLAKFLLIVANEDDPELDISDIPAFFRHLLERIDWAFDLHFQTSTTIDTLDYSGSGFNEGSKLVMAAVGPARRVLPKEIPSDCSLPEDFEEPRLCLPGILAIKSPPYADDAGEYEESLIRFTESLDARHPINAFPLVVLVDDSEFTARTVRNFLWVTFTRANPAADIHGIESFCVQKHWGCHGSLVIDARLKPHHAPPLIEDPEVTKRVDALAAAGGPLHGIF
ncbi:4-hydroxybenzoate decarboxylase subunit C [Planctomycetes bacterium Pan216]|uniref:4-hydroxybenzoate decarboxylase subunit C n=1 Tax=Kolteria novifilia TaxID=2527975 RepID=A0A518B415_9BACT|nr:4-hydroxybenzoate decarboxylase subunit C [Planctomycetes bacterium Pan216]